MARYYSDMVNYPTCVYRMYDKDGALLYVGLSMNLPGRLAKHRRKPWWPDVAAIYTESFPGREAAKDYEKWCIHHLRPVHNITRPKLVCC